VRLEPVLLLKDTLTIRARQLLLAFVDYARALCPASIASPAHGCALVDAVSIWQLMELLSWSDRGAKSQAWPPRPNKHT
jgi:hypothetical protein